MAGIFSGTLDGVWSALWRALFPQRSGLWDKLPEDLTSRLVLVAPLDVLATLEGLNRRCAAQVRARLAPFAPLANRPFCLPRDKILGLEECQMLASDGQGVGDAGAAALARALSSGALPQLDFVVLNNNAVGNVGVEALAASLAGGAMPQLEELHLSYNGFGSAGVTAIAQAIKGGALQQLGSLHLVYNRIDSDGATALAAAGGALSKLVKLFLNGNRIGDAGMHALAAAVTAEFASLKTLGVDANPGSDAPVQAALRRALLRRQQDAETFVFNAEIGAWLPASADPHAWAAANLAQPPPPAPPPSIAGTHA